MKYLVVKFWDDTADEEILGKFNTEKEARAMIDKDFEEFGSKVFIREHVAYRIQEVNENEHQR